MKYKASWKSTVHPNGKSVYVECEGSEDEIKKMVRVYYRLPSSIEIKIEKIKEE